MANVTFNIVEPLFQLEKRGEWQKELNLVSWNDKEPVYDLRSWNADHTKMGKGITLNKEEFNELKFKIQEVK